MSELSKRELLAGMAMQGIISNASLIAAIHRANLKEGHGERTQGESITTEAVQCADALLAELARTEPKQAEPDNGGWIEHKPGDPMPCDESAIVDIMLQDGTEYVGRVGDEADTWNWGEDASEEKRITAWRPAR